MNRTEEVRKLIDAFEKERDKLLDQVQYIKGHAERMEWVIKVMNAHISVVEKEEEQKIKQAAMYEEAAKVAREKGNIGAHPSERAGDLAQRRTSANTPLEESKEVSSEETKEDKKKKKS